MTPEAAVDNRLACLAYVYYLQHLAVGNSVCKVIFFRASHKSFHFTLINVRGSLWAPSVGDED